MNRFGSASGSDTGSTLLEFSLIVPLAVFMFMGVVDLSLAIAQSMIVTRAAEAGALYGTIPGNTTDTAGMRAAATSAGNGLNLFTASASIWCSCTPAGSVVSCSSSCSGSASPIQYVQVQTTAAVPVLANYPGIPTSFALKGLSVLRVQ